MAVDDRTDRWVLPDGLEDVLPPDGERYEALRRALLDVFRAWGYELVVPPLIEYIESLLTGLGTDLDLQTFKLTDLESGRTLGVRADMTPQVARIDAHQLKRSGPVRLCYAGTVLRTRREGPLASRSPVQVGAELYGHGGIASDVEVVALMLEALAVAGIDDVHLELGNAAIFRALAEAAGLDESTRERVFDALQRKARDEVAALLEPVSGARRRHAERLAALTGLNGSLTVLDEARGVLDGAPQAVGGALDALAALAAALRSRGLSPALHVDLAELHGYRYHPGIVFAAFTPGHGRDIARGGRYDDVGAAFGRARPATGFSADMRTLLALGARPGAAPDAVFAPLDADPARHERIAELRASGECVVEALSGGERPGALGCSRVLAVRDGKWVVLPAPG